MATNPIISKSEPDVYDVSGRFFPGSVITLMADDGRPVGAVQVSNFVDLKASFKVIPFIPKK